MAKKKDDKNPKRENRKAKEKLAGEVYDLMVLNRTPEQRKSLPSRESFIEAQFKAMRIGRRVFKPTTMKELEDAKAGLLANLPKKKKTPKPAASKPTNMNKSGKDKLLIHSDKDEMNVAGEKPIVINGANVKPKHVPKVLRKVAKSGGYTAWDDIKRNGKTFATEQEAKDYAADLLKKTGKVVLVSPTDRQVTHTFKPEEEKKKK